MEFSMPLHPLRNFEIQKYYQNEQRFHRVYSRDNLPEKIKNEEFSTKIDLIQFFLKKPNCFFSGYAMFNQRQRY